MNTTKTQYETTFIVNASLEDSQVDAVVNRVQDFITRNGGEISAINRWGRKRLAYTIQKKTNGFYVNIEFAAPGSLVAHLEHSFLLEENILRFLVLQLDKRALLARAQLLPKVVAEPAPPFQPPPAAAKEPLFADGPDQPRT